MILDYHRFMIQGGFAQIRGTHPSYLSYLGQCLHMSGCSFISQALPSPLWPLLSFPSLAAGQETLCECREKAAAQGIPPWIARGAPTASISPDLNLGDSQRIYAL